MSTAAFVTYNNFRDPQSFELVETGWHEKDGRRALVLQSTNSNTFGETCMRLLIGGYTIEVMEATTVITNRRIDQIWASLGEVVSTVDHVVIYLGVSGTEHAIQMARKLPIEKLIFLMCDCDIPWKEGLLAGAGLRGAKKTVVRDCGGERSMGKAYRAFLDTGTLPA